MQRKGLHRQECFAWKTDFAAGFIAALLGWGMVITRMVGIATQK
jgi:hypothetical protein